MPKYEYKIGDCVKLMKEMDHKPDLILTDPPFGVDFDYESDVFDDVRGQEYFAWCRVWMVEAMKVLKDTGTFICFTSPQFMREFMNIGFDIGLHHQDTYIWDKRGPIGFNGRRPMYCYEPAYIWTKDVKKWTFNPPAMNMLRFKPESKDVGHNCVRPVELYAKIISTHSDPGDLVLDPFVGSGTTLLACRMTGRNGMGFELDPQYEEVIKRRTFEGVVALEDFSRKRPDMVKGWESWYGKVLQ